jgi:hypothetical protein
MSNFRNFDRNTSFLLPPSVDDWLPEKHLARFDILAVSCQPLQTATQPCYTITQQNTK